MKTTIAFLLFVLCLTILLAAALSGCTTVNPHLRDGEMSKVECESRCVALGYEIREVRDGNCICNLSRCRRVESGCEPLPPPPTR